MIRRIRKLGGSWWEFRLFGLRYTWGYRSRGRLRIDL